MSKIKRLVKRVKLYILEWWYKRKIAIAADRYYKNNPEKGDELLSSVFQCDDCMPENLNDEFRGVCDKHGKQVINILKESEFL